MEDEMPNVMSWHYWWNRMTAEDYDYWLFPHNSPVGWFQQRD